MWPPHSIHNYPAKGYILEPVFIISQMSTLCIEGWNVWLFIHLKRPHSTRSKPNPVKPEPFLSFWQMKKEKKEMNYQYTSFNLYNFCIIWHFLGWWYLKKFKKTHNSCVKYDTVGVMGLKLLSGVCDHVNSTCNLTMATLLVMWSLLSASVTCSRSFQRLCCLSPKLSLTTRD